MAAESIRAIFHPWIVLFVLSELHLIQLAGLLVPSVSQVSTPTKKVYSPVKPVLRVHIRTIKVGPSVFLVALGHFRPEALQFVLHVHLVRMCLPTVRLYATHVISAVSSLHLDR